MNLIRLLLFWLLVFAEPDAETPAAVIELDSHAHRTGDIWHVWIRGVQPGHAYAFHVDGPYVPEVGHRFNRHVLLLDPCAVALAGTSRWNFAQLRTLTARDDTVATARTRETDRAWKATCLVTDTAFDWQGDRPLRHPWSRTVIYETHVRDRSLVVLVADTP